ncbi:MAG: DUF1569 domain-containing protein [Bacteroidota bacterium]
MEFIEPNLESVLPYLEKLTPETKPVWGSMSAQRMVEHLTDTLKIATGENPQKMEIPEDKLPRMIAFLESDKPMAQNIEVPFASKEMDLRQEELELAIDEFVDTWLHFEELYEQNPALNEAHPYYGPLNYAQWQRLNSKHLTHHFTQFGLM